MSERRKFLHDNMVEVRNRILFSEMKHVTVSQGNSSLSLSRTPTHTHPPPHKQVCVCCHVRTVRTQQGAGWRRHPADCYNLLKPFVSLWENNRVWWRLPSPQMWGGNRQLFQFVPCSVAGALVGAVKHGITWQYEYIYWRAAGPTTWEYFQGWESIMKAHRRLRPCSIMLASLNVLQPQPYLL